MLEKKVLNGYQDILLQFPPSYCLWTPDFVCVLTTCFWCWDLWTGGKVVYVSSKQTHSESPWEANSPVKWCTPVCFEAQKIHISLMHSWCPSMHRLIVPWNLKFQHGRIHIQVYMCSNDALLFFWRFVSLFFLLDLLKKASHICLCLHNHHNKYFSKLVNAVLLVNPLTVLKLVKLVNSSLFCGYMRYPEIICCPNCCWNTLF